MMRFTLGGPTDEMSCRLPTVSGVLADPETLLRGLDPEQRAVATTFGQPLAVIAGAGTGKTRALTHRIAYAVASERFSPSAVLAVTFTTRAAGELRSRLRGLGIPAVQARTFHSAALRQAQYFWPKAYGSELPPVSTERMAMVAEATRRLRLSSPDTATLRDLVSEVSWAKVSNVLPADYPQLAQPAGREVSGMDPATVAKVLGRYEQVKTERGVIDFDDILLCTVALLSDNADVAEQVRGTYRHLLVDEYQDVSPLQQGLLDLWWGDGVDHCVVGDPAQTIHSFAGATPGYLTGFSVRHPNAAVIRLVRDYRSSEPVVKLANQLSVRSRIAAVTLESQAGPGPEPRFLGCSSEADEVAAVTAWLVARHEEGVPWRELAVLYRVHAQSPAYEAALAQAGVPFTVRGGEGFFDRPEVRQVISTLADRARREPAADALDACRAVLTATGWTEQAPTGQGRVRERWESLAAVLALAEELVAAGNADLAGLMTELSERAQAEHPLSADGITLSTLHGAKGLEWHSVALVGVQEGTLPLAQAAGPEQLQEEARLFYVGITRARRGLLITWSRFRNGGVRQPSRFLNGLTSSARSLGPRPARRSKPKTEMSARCRVCGGPLSTGAERKLSRHLSCAVDFDEALYQELTSWRSVVAAKRSLPAYCIFTDATLLAIAEQLPVDEQALLAIPGVGKAKLEAYSADLLKLIAERG